MARVNPTDPKKLERPLDLEIKDEQVIFSTVWQELEEELGRENLRFPKA